MTVLAEVVRSGLVESRHHGSAVMLDADGSVDVVLGSADDDVFGRSANKPFQALGMLRSGLDVDGELLALATASHSGEPFHLAGVRRMLAEVGLDEHALQTPASYPVDGHEHAAVIRAGESKAPLRMDCSGKHAAMLRTCVLAGWSTHDYLDPRHPLQQQIAEVFAEQMGAAPAVIGVDGCGAPLFSATLTRLAQAMGRIGRAEAGTHEARLAEAMRSFGQWVSGTRRDELQIMVSVPGLIGKSGAEAVYVAAMNDGRALAVKIEDGSERALYPVVWRLLERWGIESPRSWPILGGGQPVGEIRAAF